ncbi:glycosyltransferase [Terrilactibacillus laevilacticus]|uniref:Glycosyltransferase n=1 Tax=Terrilactibacillus laevilacticus TaxID=1380157 RepID=A0ABW5PLR9_9BACI|nr:glycosyltransferase [Terrilactibacillus laevilacticus]
MAHEENRFSIYNTVMKLVPGDKLNVFLKGSNRSLMMTFSKFNHHCLIGFDLNKRTVHLNYQDVIALELNSASLLYNKSSSTPCSTQTNEATFKSELSSNNQTTHSQEKKTNQDKKEISQSKISNRFDSYIRQSSTLKKILLPPASFIDEPEVMLDKKSDQNDLEYKPHHPSEDTMNKKARSDFHQPYRKKVSIILSSYNAKERLLLALRSYLYQDFPKESFEVIVVDDGSTDQTMAAISQIQTNYSLKYIRLPNNSGRSCARNRGIEASTGEIIIFSDSDMIAEPNFITKHVTLHEKYDKIFVCGSFWNKIHENFSEQEGTYIPSINPQDILTGQLFAHSSKQDFSGWYELFVNQYDSELSGFEFPWMYFIIMNCSVKSRHLKKIGMFDEHFQGYGGEDEEMGYRLWKDGLKGIVDTSIKNYHQEHPRSKFQAHESQQNIHYIIDKHQEINPIMYYRIDFIEPIEKSHVLQLIRYVINEKLVSGSFEQNCYDLLFNYHKGIHYPVPQEFIWDVARLQDDSNLKSLTDFLMKLISILNIRENEY